MRMLKALDSRRTGGKRGFTLIELLIVMVILAILAGIVIISIGGVIGRGQETAYNAEEESLQTAVLSYYASNNSTWPTAVGGSATAGIILMEELTVAVAPALPYLDEAPKSAHVSNYVVDPGNTGHYVWMVDASAHVYSECVDLTAGDCTIDCDGTYEPTGPEEVGGDGWQDVYP